MNVHPERSSSPIQRVSMIAITLLVVLSAIPFGVNAEIPHENYDLASSDLDTVIALLNSSIRSFERSLIALNEEDTTTAGEYIDRVSTVLQPVEDILEDIQDVAGSYENLNDMLPPFASLYDSTDSFLGMEVDLLETSGKIVSSSELLNLSDEQLIEALDDIENFNSLANRMNSTIDEMLVHALEINALTVDDATPFVPNDLIELIEQLRDMIGKIFTDMQRVIDEDIPWDSDVSFILIWIEDQNLYLGETIVGGGYLFIHGSFVVGETVNISMDGVQLLQAMTGTAGRYSFTQTIPLNVSWLGTHTIIAHAYTENGTLDSDPVNIIISLVPTTIRLTADMTVMSLDETVNLQAKLSDVKGKPLSRMNCSLTINGEEDAFITDDVGSEEWSWDGSELGYGTHVMSASFPGVLPYAPSSSRDVTVVVDIPTNITINLFADRLGKKGHVVGDGMLVSNGSQPLGMQNLSLFVDGEYFRDVKTEADGVFAFSISTDNMTVGTHVLRAAFVQRDDIWRYSEADASFVIISLKYADYPFFPRIPGWSIGLAEEIPYLFFGEYAYYTWMFIVLVVGIVIKALQVRKARRTKERELAPSPEDDLEEGMEFGTQEERYLVPEPAPDWLSGPNEKIVWYYNKMISFLMRRRKIGITDNMTHWEVAHLLRALGYPAITTTTVTVLFERAYYSGSTLSMADEIQMGSSTHTMKRTGGTDLAG